MRRFTGSMAVDERSPCCVNIYNKSEVTKVSCCVHAGCTWFMLEMLAVCLSYSSPNMAQTVVSHIGLLYTHMAWCALMKGPFLEGEADALGTPHKTVGFSHPGLPVPTPGQLQQCQVREGGRGREGESELAKDPVHGHKAFSAVCIHVLCISKSSGDIQQACQWPRPEAHGHTRSNHQK